MRSGWVTVLVGGVVILLASSCATVPTEPLASGELRLLGMHVPMMEDIKLNFTFAVNINFEADGKPEIRTACFSFSGDGPYCYKVMDVNYGSPGTIKVKLTVTKPGSYVLESYVVYTQEGKGRPTNVVSSNIGVLR